MTQTLIIAEAGVNHNGDMGLARQLIDAAADAGADAVKFQTFIADNLVTRAARKADYQVDRLMVAESQHTMLRRLELTRAMHEELIAHCTKRGIERQYSVAFGFRPHDIQDPIRRDNQSSVYQADRQTRWARLALDRYGYAW
jgi:N,N'-diacetyllegionaminate synthase